MAFHWVLEPYCFHLLYLHVKIQKHFSVIFSSLKLAVSRRLILSPRLQTISDCCQLLAGDEVPGVQPVRIVSVGCEVRLLLLKFAWLLPWLEKNFTVVYLISTLKAADWIPSGNRMVQIDGQTCLIQQIFLSHFLPWLLCKSNQHPLFFDSNPLPIH